MKADRQPGVLVDTGVRFIVEAPVIVPFHRTGFAVYSRLYTNFRNMRRKSGIFTEKNYFFVKEKQQYATSLGRYTAIGSNAGH